MVDFLNNIETSTAPGVSIVNNKIKKRSQITVRNAYVSPLLQQFNLTGDVFIKNLVSVNEIERKVNNAIYEFLDEKSDFAQPLYLSNIIELIESFPEVINTTPTFTPISGTGTPLYSTLELDQDITGYGAPEKQIIVSQFSDSFQNFMPTYGYDGTENFDKDFMTSGSNTAYDIKVWEKNYLNNPPYGYTGGGSPNTELKGHIRVANISERTFYEKFVKHFYNGIQGTVAESFAKSNDFKSLVSRANQEMKFMIRSSMKDQSGNIVNYSFQHEIAQVISNLNFKYRN